MPKSFRLSLYPWITQHISATELRAQIESFGSVLQEQLSDCFGSGVRLEVLEPLDVSPQISQLAAGGADIALMNPLGYIFARQQNQDIDVVAVAERIIDGKPGTTYFSQVYTHVQTAIRHIEQFRGRSIGFGVAFSTSNFLVPAAELKARGINPLSAFQRVEFLGGHDLVAQAVYERKIDLGAGHDGVINDLSNQYGYGDARQQLVTILRSAPIPSDPIAALIPDPDVKGGVQDALIKAGRIETGKDALVRFWGGVVGLQPITADSYDELESMLANLGFTADDLLRRSTIARCQRSPVAAS
jgi:phosphonate transport system substrate-binding protein